MRKVLLLLVCAIVLVGCSQQKPQKGENGVMLDLDNYSNDGLVLGDVMEVCEWIKLENSPDCLLQFVDKVEFFNGEYYILDRTVHSKVFVFDSKGKLVKSIGNKGGGPGEYADIYDFAIDKTNGNVYILTNPSVVFLYDNNGKFIKSKALDESYLWKITSMDNGILLSSIHRTYTEGENAFLFYEFDKNLDFKQKQINVLPKQMSSMLFLTNPFQVSDGKVYYCDDFCYKIYSFDSGKIDKEYSVKLSDAMGYELRTDFMTANEHLSEHDFIMNFAVSDKSFLLVYVRKGPMYVAVIDKMSNTVIKNNILREIFPNIICSCAKDEFLSPISIEGFQNFWKNSKVKQPDFKVDDEDNFLIMKWKLKSDFSE